MQLTNSLNGESTKDLVPASSIKETTQSFRAFTTFLLERFKKNLIETEPTIKMEVIETTSTPTKRGFQMRKTDSNIHSALTDRGCKGQPMHKDVIRECLSTDMGNI